jgi:hypothetical protein
VFFLFLGTANDGYENLQDYFLIKHKTQCHAREGGYDAKSVYAEL